MPSPVDRYFKEVKDQNPSYSDEQAWATAWSIYCKHKNPGSDHCQKDPSEYLTGKSAGVVVRVAARYVEALEVPLAERLASRYLAASAFTDEELAIIALMAALKPAARGEAFDRAGLGKYGPENEHIQGLVKKGLIKLQGGKAVTLVGGYDKAKALLKDHRVPEKYKRHIDNWSMFFKTRE